MIIDEIISNEECFSVKNLAIDGNDLMEIGYRGKKIGEMLNTLLNMVINEKIKNDYDALLLYSKDNFT